MREDAKAIHLLLATAVPPSDERGNAINAGS